LDARGEMFWDLYLRWVYRTLGGNLAGLVSAGRIFAEAHRLRLLDPAAADDDSVTVLLRTCPPRTPLRQAADTEFHRRQLGQGRRAEELFERLTVSACADEQLLL